jgi:hypothetical protein
MGILLRRKGGQMIEIAAFLFVASIFGALAGWVIGVLTGAVALGTILGAILGPIAAAVGFVIHLYLGESKRPPDDD